jgi:hypothetical protein
MTDGRAETLSELYPRATALREVRDDFRGMPLRLWQRLEMREQFDTYYATAPAPPLSAQAVHSGRDDYGKKSADVPVGKRSERPKLP